MRVAEARRRLGEATPAAVDRPRPVGRGDRRGLFEPLAVEPLFAALKLSDGMGAMWQRGRTALLRWLHLVQIGRALLVLLTAKAEPETLAVVRVGGWRRQRR